MKSKGFTLVELLVTIAVLGIVSGISVPIIRNIQHYQAEKKYKSYQDSVTLSAKLYTDSYSKDMFQREKGCTYIYYKDMDKYGLLKDINTSNLSCNTDSTVVEVVKFREKYYYKSYIGCGTLKNGKIEPDIFRPEKFEESELCNQESDSTIAFVSEPNGSTAVTNKVFDPKVKIISKTGVKNTPNPPVIDYGYSYSDTDIDIIGGEEALKPVSFAIAKESVQLEMIRNMEEQRFLSKTSLITPKDITGKIYLVLKVSSLYNLDRDPWKTVYTDKDKYVIFKKPFTVDNEKPKFNNLEIVSSEDSYKARTPKLKLSASDERYSGTNLKVCYSYDEKCPKPSNDKDLQKMACSGSPRKGCYSNYNTTNISRLLDEISTKYDGSEHNVYVSIADQAGNFLEDRRKYKVANSYKLKFDPNGGNTCNVTEIGQIEGKEWGEKVVNEAGLNKHDFCKAEKTGYNFKGWYLNKNGTGYEITKASKATSDITVYAKWEPKTVKVTFNCNGGTGGGEETFTYNVSGQKFSKTCSMKGHELSGWKLKKSSTSKDYTVTNGVSNDWIDKNSPSITIYAHWTPKKYTCSKGYYLKKTAISCRECTSAHYCPGGTYTYNENNDQGINDCPRGYSNSAVGSSKNTNCYMSVPENKYVKVARDTTATDCPVGYERSGVDKVYYGSTNSCSLKSYTLTYNSNGGAGTMSTQSCKHNQDCTLKNNSFTNTGHKWSGWYSSSSGGTKYSSTIKITANTTVYAHWEPNVIKLKYNTNGGRLIDPHGSTYEILSNGIVKRDGKEVFYTINYGGSLNGDGLLNYDNNRHLNIARTGHHIISGKEWNTDPNGTGTTFNQTEAYPGSRFCDASNGDCEKILYANWVLKTIKVTFNCNGGTGGGEQTFTYGTSGQKFSTTCSRATYTLSGWKLNQNGTTHDYSVSSGVSDGWIDGHAPSVTVYAHWVPKTYTLKYDDKGGSGCSSKSITKQEGEAWGTLCTPQRDGYTFTGWTDGSSAISATTKATSNVTAVATWSLVKKPITVTLSSLSKVYNGSKLECSSECSVTNGSLASGDTISCTCSGSQDGTGTSTSTLTKVVVKNSSGTDVTNKYNITKKNGTLTVSCNRKVTKVSDTPGAIAVNDKVKYGGIEWTVVSMSNGNINLAYNGKVDANGSTSGTTPGRYNKASEAVEKWLNSSAILKDSLANSCITNKGSSSGSEAKNKPASYYWLSDGKVYTPNDVKKCTLDSEERYYYAYTEYNLYEGTDVLYHKDIHPSASCENKKGNATAGGYKLISSDYSTFVFGDTGYTNDGSSFLGSPYYHKFRIPKTNATISSSKLPIHLYSSYSGESHDYNEKIYKMKVCGGNYNKETHEFSADSSSQYYMDTSKFSGEVGHTAQQIMYYASFASSSVSGSTRTFDYYNSSTCLSRTNYKLTSTTVNIYYRPYIIVKNYN